MKKSTFLLKKIWMLMAILFLGVVSAQAVNVTFVLKTHVDQRTLSETKNINTTSSLSSVMPDNLWRADCTYKFYADEALTQQITTAGDLTTVYVDYTFEPLFTVSTPDNEVYYLFNGYIGDNRFYMEEKEYRGEEYSASESRTDLARYAIYGDAYSINLKNKQTGKWVTYNNTRSMDPSDNPMETGWQWCKSAAKYTYSSGSDQNKVALATTDNRIMFYNSYGGATGNFIVANPSNYDLTWVSKHELSHPSQGATGNCHNGSFFFTAGQYTNQYQVEYKIRKYDGTWISIVKQKGPTAANPATLNSSLYPDYDATTYTYFSWYTDDTFGTQFEGKLQPGRSDVLYAKEVLYTSTPWMTLVLPFPISSPEDYFGENATISINEYTSVVSHISSNGESFSCKLNFTTKNEIEAYKPYLFKAENVDAALLNWALQINEGTDLTSLTPIDKTDDTNAAGIKVSMIGVLNPDGYSMPADGLKFFFGSKDNGEGNYTYKFVIPNSEVTIPQFRCYFYVTDERSNASTFALDFDDIELTGIGQTTFSTVTNSPIYNINGQKMSTTKTSDLPKGLYIVNGKKIIVK